MKQQEILENVSDDLSIIEITYGNNGYPKNLGDKGVIGFSDFKEAEDFVRKFGGEITYFKKRDGWEFWENRGWVDKPFSVDDYLRELGDNYSVFEPDLDVVTETVKDILTYKNISNAIDYLTRMDVMIEEYQNKEEGECIITRFGEYYEIARGEMMSFYEDVWKHEIGVLIKKKTEEDEHN